MESKDDVRFENVNEDLLVSNIKRHLMSRDDKIKLEAVQFLLIYLEFKTSGNDDTSQNVCDRFIEADIVEYLGEAMATQDSILLREILKCLEFFLNSEKFSTQIRAAYVVECMQRTLYFLFKQSQKELSTANDALRLLAVFIEEFNKNLTLKQLFGNNANISQVLSLVMSILKNKEELGDEIIINASLVLYSLFSQSDPALTNCDFLREVPDVIQKSLASLALLCNSKDFERICAKIIALMAKIGSGALRYAIMVLSCHIFC
ncbi:hypothetical protein R5R35_011135 [Gryllus longicercus]|uniref:Uncharacterized protein n=1 Tax=Gryllus longicercus TaxID=2509291 RepID=A0AAN9YYT4_9ORTH